MSMQEAELLEARARAAIWGDQPSMEIILMREIVTLRERVTVLEALQKMRDETERAKAKALSFSSQTSTA